MGNIKKNLCKDLCIIASINTKTNKVSNYCCRKVLLSAPLAISRSMAISNLSKVKSFILDNQLRANCVKSFLIVKKPFWPQVMPYSQAHILLIWAMISLRMICHAESWYSSIMEKNTRWMVVLIRILTKLIRSQEKICHRSDLSTIQSNWRIKKTILARRPRLQFLLYGKLVHPKWISILYKPKYILHHTKIWLEYWRLLSRWKGHILYWIGV